MNDPHKLLDDVYNVSYIDIFLSLIGLQYHYLTSHSDLMDLWSIGGRDLPDDINSNTTIVMQYILH